MPPRKRDASAAAPAAQNQTPTYANAFLLLEAISPGFLWQNETFLGIARLSPDNFLDPGFKHLAGPASGRSLTTESVDGIKAWYSQVRNSPALLRSTALATTPGYKHFMNALTRHFRRTVDPAILALMQDACSTPVTMRRATKGAALQKITAGTCFPALQSDLAYLLLGDAALYGNSVHVIPAVSDALRAIHFRLWERLVKQESTCTTRIATELDNLPDLVARKSPSPPSLLSLPPDRAWLSRIRCRPKSRLLPGRNPVPCRPRRRPRRPRP